MKIETIDINRLSEAPWNPNQMDETMSNRLKLSLSQYGLVEPLVVRKMKDSTFEVLSGNQRFRVLGEMGKIALPCVVLDLEDSEARLLAQALNCLRGEDDLALKGELLQKVLESVPESQVLSLLPETKDSLRSLATIGQNDLAEQLKAWEQAQAARLRHMQLQFTNQQLEVVEEAVSRIMPVAKEEVEANPNKRGNAVYQLCRFYLDNAGEE